MAIIISGPENKGEKWITRDLGQNCQLWYPEGHLSLEHTPANSEGYHLGTRGHFCLVCIMLIIDIPGTGDGGQRGGGELLHQTSRSRRR